MNPGRGLGLVLLGAVTVTLMAGTFVLLALGKPVPEPVWVSWGAAVTALFGHGAFLAQAQTHQNVVGDLLDAVTVGAGAATTGATGSPTNGKTGVGGPAVPPTEAGVDSAPRMSPGP